MKNCRKIGLIYLTSVLNAVSGPFNKLTVNMLKKTVLTLLIIMGVSVFGFGQY